MVYDPRQNTEAKWYRANSTLPQHSEIHCRSLGGVSLHNWGKRQALSLVVTLHRERGPSRHDANRSAKEEKSKTTEHPSTGEKNREVNAKRLSCDSDGTSMRGRDFLEPLTILCTRKGGSWLYFATLTRKTRRPISPRRFIGTRRLAISLGIKMKALRQANITSQRNEVNAPNIGFIRNPISLNEEKRQQ